MLKRLPQISQDVWKNVVERFIDPITHFKYKILEDEGDGGYLADDVDQLIEHAYNTTYSYNNEDEFKNDIRECFYALDGEKLESTMRLEEMHDGFCVLHVEILKKRPRNLSLESIFYRHGWNEEYDWNFRTEDGHLATQDNEDFGYTLYRWGPFYILSSGFKCC